MLNKFGLRFHHLGLAVKEPSIATTFLKGLEYSIGDTFFDANQNVNACLCTHHAFPAVEILFPASGKTPFDRLLGKYSNGLVYHMCFASENVAASLSAMEAEDLHIVCVSSPKPALLFGNVPVSFYMVADMGLIEIIDNSSRALKG